MLAQNVEELVRQVRLEDIDEVVQKLKEKRENALNRKFSVSEQWTLQGCLRMYLIRAAFEFQEIFEVDILEAKKAVEEYRFCHNQVAKT